MANQPVDWDSGLLDCFEDASACCYGFWCAPCFSCTVSRRFGENTCLPLCDVCIPSTCGFPTFAPPASLALRAAMRNRYNIKGSICNDIIVSCCCNQCSWCQMYRELKHRKKTPTVVNIQNQAVFTAQPAPMMMMPQGVMMMPQGVMMPQQVITTSE